MGAGVGGERAGSTTGLVVNNEWAARRTQHDTYVCGKMCFGLIMLDWKPARNIFVSSMRNLIKLLL